MVHDPSSILKDWTTSIVDKNSITDRKAVHQFILKHFKIPAGSDVTPCIPLDYDPVINIPPALKNRISDPKLQVFASAIYALWTSLCKQIGDSVYTNPQRHSLLPLSHSQMIVAGGRFREVYYWEFGPF